MVWCLLNSNVLYVIQSLRAFRRAWNGNRRTALRICVIGWLAGSGGSGCLGFGLGFGFGLGLEFGFWLEFELGLEFRFELEFGSIFTWFLSFGTTFWWYVGVLESLFCDMLGLGTCLASWGVFGRPKWLNLVHCTPGLDHFGHHFGSLVWWKTCLFNVVFLNSFMDCFFIDF